MEDQKRHYIGSIDVRTYTLNGLLHHTANIYLETRPYFKSHVLVKALISPSGERPFNERTNDIKMNLHQTNFQETDRFVAQNESVTISHRTIASTTIAATKFLHLRRFTFLSMFYFSSLNLCS